MLVLLPFALLSALLAALADPAASLWVTAYGVPTRAARHPRARAHPPDADRAWSFAATAHGAALMLVPIYLARPRIFDDGHQAAGTLINDNLAMAVNVSIAHTMAMLAAADCWRADVPLPRRAIRVAELVQLDLVWATSLYSS
jgi:hypothetical protein